MDCGAKATWSCEEVKYTTKAHATANGVNQYTFLTTARQTTLFMLPLRNYSFPRDLHGRLDVGPLAWSSLPKPMIGTAHHGRIRTVAATAAGEDAAKLDNQLPSQWHGQNRRSIAPAGDDAGGPLARRSLRAKC